NHTLPVASNDSSATRYLPSGTSTNCSCEQMMPLSNEAPATIFAAASAKSTSLSTMTGTFPAPTPKEGLPEEYADFTMAAPPVATTTSTTFINSWVVWMVPFWIVWIKSSGPPLAFTTFMNSRVMRAFNFSALGCGAKMTALPVFTANMTLHIGVTTGFVTGVTAATTPMGLATNTIFVSASSPMMPRDFLSLRLFQMTRALPLFLRILSS